MLLFKKAFHEGLASGRITLTFRRWQTAHVKAGGRYRCHPIGVLEVDDVRQVAVREITDEDAVRSGFATRAELLEYLKEAPGASGPLNAKTVVWRVELHHGGDGDRVDLALQDDLSADDIATIRAKLERMDRDTPWTAATLAIIEKNPRVVASQLAKTLGRVREEFKADVRKLKKLGLTQSFEVGYEIAPRGRAYLAATRVKRKKTP
jgi:hypothetical protein